MENFPPLTPIIDTLRGLTIKLQEGSDYIDEVQRNFGLQKLQSRRMINMLSKSLKSRVKRLKESGVQKALKKIHSMFLRSHKRFTRAKRFLMHIYKNETEFLNEGTRFNDLLPKVNSILQDLDIAIDESNTRRKLNNENISAETYTSKISDKIDHARNSTDDESESSSSSDDSEDESKDEVDDNSDDDMTYRSRDRYGRWQEDFIKLYKIKLMFERERSNYELLYNFHPMKTSQ
ncbi:uncharacterized protein LOC127718152 [Mytilus californianus]|uniref:uncharacterized protein LOC127718152 n=1 Tax=Mytilus californianus TaxID=6549 RepID=UPI00224551FB|nr:uncharacterized protein LOC127718152 [Mytilus californianus]